MSLHLILFLLPWCVVSLEFNLLAIKRDESVGRQVLDSIRDGKFIGCKYQNLCMEKTFCYNDKLFGSCLSEFDERNFGYELSPQFSSLLEGAMLELWQEGFHWRDFYTQCFLQTVILTSELQKDLDVTFCKENRQDEINKRSGENDIYEVNADDGVTQSLPPRYLLVDRLSKLFEDARRREYPRKKSSEERINPKSNSEEARSITKVHYEDPQVLRETLKVAKRRRDEWIWLKFARNFTKDEESFIMNSVSDSLKIPKNNIKSHTSPDLSTIYFKLPHQYYIPSSNVTQFFKAHKDAIEGLPIVDAGDGHLAGMHEEPIPKNANFIITIIICGVVLFGVIVVLICFCIQKFRYKKDKMGDMINTKFTDTTSSYKDLFRVSSNKESASLKSKQGVSRMNNKQHSGDTPAASSPVSTRSSTSSWTDDIPSTTNMDIYTGHMILSYMEKHLKNRDMFQTEWNSIQLYEAEDNLAEIALKPENISKNRYDNKIPYDKSRVVLKNPKNGDYINASLIVDSDPRLPAYIAAQSPTEKTIVDFWQMIWEQGIVVIITLTELDEKDICNYWPKEGSEIYNTYEINLVSEHIWSDEYLVRNFYLKNLENSETKTVTQFHFFSWPFDKLPSSSRSILEFRRKVNKSYRSKSTPILVHCKDGCGRTGTYILLDLILNRVGKGLKEMDIAATLEHLRDQRMNLVNTEEQFRYVLNTISDEVNNILKIVNQ